MTKTNRRRKAPVSKVNPLTLTVMPPEGITVNIMQNWSTITIPHGDTLTVEYITSFSTPNSGKRKESYVVFKWLEGGREVRIDYKQASQMREEGSLRE